MTDLFRAALNRTSMLDIPLSNLWLLPLGLLIGAFGTLIGAGGGFVLVPILLILYPNDNTELITSISLAVVFFNALSGSVAYARMKRVDYKSGVMFAIATIPGAILGAVLVSYVPRYAFDITFGVIMIAAGIFLWLTAKDDHSRAQAHTNQLANGHTPARWSVRELIDADGTRHHYAYNPVIGIVLSVFVGFISSLLGVGGGFIHVPALTGLLHFPVHVATATSHFVLAIMALTGTLVHIATGTFAHGVRKTAILAVGVVLG
ncbi:MAG: sulfite exporter TauE/SafE family protein, partial [Candidatus Binatia bacterium]